MNDKEKKLAEKIGVAIEEIWTNYYTDEGIGVGDIEPHAAVQYERLIDNIAEIIYRTGESNREVRMIKDLDIFEKAMQEKYPILVEIRDEEVIYFDGGKKERYTAWLKFPYYSTDSNGGLFSFFTEEEFEQYMTSSIRMFTEEEIKNEQFEIEQYEEFYEKHVAVFNLDKALYLFYKARMEMQKNQKFKVAIEEHINQIFEVEAADLEEAMQLAEERYRKGEYVLGGDSEVTARLMQAWGDGDYTEWVEF